MLVILLPSVNIGVLWLLLLHDHNPKGVCERTLLGLRVFKSSAKLRILGKGFRLQSNDGKLWARSQENAVGPSWLDTLPRGL